MDSIWKRHNRHLFVLTSAGKPVFTLHDPEVDGTEGQNVTNCVSLINAIIARTEETGDPIKSISTPDTTFVFTLRGPLYFVCVFRTGETLHAVAELLRLAHTILRMHLTARIEARLIDRPKTDIRTQVDAFSTCITNGVRLCNRMPSVWLDALPILPIVSTIRSRIITALTGAGTRGGSTVFAMLIAGYSMVAWAQTRSKEYALRAHDFNALACTIQSQPRLRHVHSSIIPLCMPQLDASGYLNTYIACLGASVLTATTLVSPSKEFHVFPPLTHSSQGTPAKAKDEADRLTGVAAAAAAEDTSPGIPGAGLSHSRRASSAGVEPVTLFTTAVTPAASGDTSTPTSASTTFTTAYPSVSASPTAAVHVPAYDGSPVVWREDSSASMALSADDARGRTGSSTMTDADTNGAAGSSSTSAWPFASSVIPDLPGRVVSGGRMTTSEQPTMPSSDSELLRTDAADSMRAGNSSINGPGYAPVTSSATAPPYHPDTEAPGIFLVLMTADSSPGLADVLDARRDAVVSALHSSGALLHVHRTLAITGAVGVGDYSPALYRLPGVLHFVYVWKPLRQYSMCRLPTLIATHVQRKALLRGYQYAYDKITMPAPQLRHYCASFVGVDGIAHMAGIHTTHAIVLAAIDASVGADRAPAIMEKLAKQLQRDHDRLIVTSPGVF